MCYWDDGHLLKALTTFNWFDLKPFVPFDLDPRGHLKKVHLRWLPGDVSDKNILWTFYIFDLHPDDSWGQGQSFYDPQVIHTKFHPDTWNSIQLVSTKSRSQQQCHISCLSVSGDPKITYTKFHSDPCNSKPLGQHN